MPLKVILFYNSMYSKIKTVDTGFELDEISSDDEENFYLQDLADEIKYPTTQNAQQKRERHERFRRNKDLESKRNNIKKVYCPLKRFLKTAKSTTDNAIIATILLESIPTIPHPNSAYFRHIAGIRPIYTNPIDAIEASGVDNGEFIIECGSAYVICKTAQEAIQLCSSIDRFHIHQKYHLVVPSGHKIMLSIVLNSNHINIITEFLPLIATYFKVSVGQLVYTCENEQATFIIPTIIGELVENTMQVFKFKQSIGDNKAAAIQENRLYVTSGSDLSYSLYPINQLFPYSISHIVVNDVKTGILKQTPTEAWISKHSPANVAVSIYYSKYKESIEDPLSSTDFNKMISGLGYKREKRKEKDTSKFYWIHQVDFKSNPSTVNIDSEDGYLYLLEIIDAETKESVFKIGKSKSLKRPNDDYHGHIIHLTKRVSGYGEAEKRLIKTFRKEFKLFKGREWFQGSLVKMKTLFNELDDVPKSKGVKNKVAASDSDSEDDD